jgi:hypothetical protein
MAVAPVERRFGSHSPEAALLFVAKRLLVNRPLFVTR